MQVADTRSLAGLRVLVVEDEALLSMLVEDALKESGCTVLGPYMHVDAAMPVVLDRAQAIDLAMLDLEIAGEWSFSLAERLIDRKVPVVFSTGHDEAAIDARWRWIPRLRKPFSDQELMRILAEVAAGRAT